MKDIFSPVKANNVDLVPYNEFLIFAGLCFVAALSARKFLDSVSQQVLREVSRLDQRTGKVQEIQILSLHRSSQILLAVPAAEPARELEKKRV